MHPMHSPSQIARGFHASILAGAIGISTLASSAQPVTLTYIAELGDQAHRLNEYGYVLGVSNGSVTWLADPTGHITFQGLRDGLHASNKPIDLNSGGVSIGEAERVTGGQSAWIADRHGTTLKVGFYGSDFTLPDGSKFSFIFDLNDRNEAVGVSFRNSTKASSQIAWLATSVGKITRIGFYDAIHTDVNGDQVSTPWAINAAGHVVGVSSYFYGEESQRGGTTWLRKRWGDTRRIGFQSGIHQSLSGHYSNEVRFFTDSSYVGGEAKRYVPGTDQANGTTAWVTHVDGPNRPVGLYDADHVSSSGGAESAISGLNEAGMSAGTSNDIRGGRTAWLAEPTGQTVPIGLTDAEHTVDGSGWPTVLLMNETMVIGLAERFDPITGTSWEGQGGFSGWVTSIETRQTANLSLTDAAHTRSDGWRETIPLGASPTRCVWGQSARYADTRPDGRVPQTTWIYDLSSGSMTVLNTTPGAPSQFAISDITVVSLGDDGVAFGHYGIPQDGIPFRAFVYEPRYGVRALDRALGVSAASLGWARFSQVTHVSRSGYIVGQGITSNGRNRVFFLSTRGAGALAPRAARGERRPADRT